MNALLVALAMGGAGVLTSIITGLFVVKRNSISGAKELVEAAILLVEPQTEQMAGLVLAISELKAEVNALSVHVDALSAQIISLGAIPIPKPLMESQWNL
jgi:hypothetical protein